MTDQTSEEIQRDIETERSEMNQTLSELTSRLSPDHLFREVSDHFRQHGGDIGRSVGETVKQNPLALALTGIGLSWLIFGQKTTSSHSTSRDTASASMAPTGRADLPADASMIQRPSYPAWTRSVPTGNSTNHSTGQGTTDQGRLSRAQQSVSAGKADLAGRVDSVKDGISDRVHGAKDGASDLLERGRDGLADMRDRLSHGTEHLSSEARDRVVAARERAMAAQHAARDQIRRGSAEISNYYDQQPLIFGALAMAVGAALAGSLPRSKFEDEHLGQQSDQLIEEAERILHEETEKTKAVYSAVKSEVSDIADEARNATDDRTPGDNSAAHSARQYVEQTSKRLADTAKDEADRQDLGKPS